MKGEFEAQAATAPEALVALGFAIVMADARVQLLFLSAALAPACDLS